MIRTIKSNRPGNILLIIFFGLLGWMGRFIAPEAVTVPTQGKLLSTPVWRMMEAWFMSYNWIAVVMPFVFLLIAAFLLVRINRKYILLNERTYLPALFLVLLSGGWISQQGPHPVWIITLLVFLLIDTLFQLYRSNYALNKLYMAGFYIALGSIFYVPFVFYIFLVYVALVLLRPFIGREWLVPILGFATPYLFLLTYYFGFTEKWEHVITVILNNLDYYFQWPHLSAVMQIYIVLVALLIIIASAVLVRNLRIKKVRTRKYFELLLWIFIISVALFLFLPNVGAEIMLVASLPTTYVFTEYMYHSRKNWPGTIFFYLLLAGVLFVQIETYFNLIF